MPEDSPGREPADGHGHVPPRDPGGPGFVSTVGDRFRLGMGLALFWARVKSTLEAERTRIEQNIKSLDMEE